MLYWTWFYICIFIISLLAISIGILVVTWIRQLLVVFTACLLTVTKKNSGQSEVHSYLSRRRKTTAESRDQMCALSILGALHSTTNTTRQSFQPVLTGRLRSFWNWDGSSRATFGPSVASSLSSIPASPFSRRTTTVNTWTWWSTHSDEIAASSFSSIF